MITRKKRAAAALAALGMTVLFTGCGEKAPNFKTAVEEIKDPFDAEYKNKDGEPLGYFDKYIQKNLTTAEDGTSLEFKFNNVDFNSYYEKYKDDKDKWETTLRLIFLKSEYEADLKYIEMFNQKLGVPDTVLSQIKSAAPTYQSSLNSALAASGHGDAAQKSDEDHTEFTEDCGSYTIKFTQDKKDAITVDAVLTYTAK